MAKERLPMHRVREVLRLKHVCHLSNRKIARASGVDRDTVGMLLAYIKFQCRFQRSLFLLQRLVQNTLLDRLSLIDLLRLPEKKLPALRNAGPQLCLAL